MNNTVEKYLRMSAKNLNRKSLFAMDTGNGTEFFNVLAVIGRGGRPSKGSATGAGSRTHTVVRNFVSGRKSTLMLSTLIDRNVRKVLNKFTNHL